MRKSLDYRSIDFENISFEVTFEENDPEILGVYCEHSDINLYPYLQDFLIDALQENLEEDLAEEKLNRFNDHHKYDWDPESWGRK